MRPLRPCRVQRIRLAVSSSDQRGVYLDAYHGSHPFLHKCLALILSSSHFRLILVGDFKFPVAVS
jgi:hypothetical protein